MFSVVRAMEVVMDRVENGPCGDRRASPQCSYEDVNEAVARGTPAACSSAFAVTIGILAMLWFGHFASERAMPAWQAVEREAAALKQEVHSVSSQACGFGEFHYLLGVLPMARSVRAP
jgi:hypothetical protein